MSRLTIPVSDADHRSGPVSARLTLVEYGDYECPYCGAAYPVLKAVQQAMGDKLSFVFRNFPLTEMHPHALHAAEFAELAASVGKFWEAHDMLYEHQRGLSDDRLFQYGEVLGLNKTQIVAAFEGQFGDKIQTDFSGGIRSGVNGTPSLFINTMRYDGPCEFNALVDVLREIDEGLTSGI